MKKRWLGAWVVLALVATAFKADAGVSVSRYDCRSVGEYFGGNAKAITTFGKALVPFALRDGRAVLSTAADADVVDHAVSLVEGLFPDVNVSASAPFQYVGLGIGSRVLGAYLQLGLSPIGFVNLFSHLVCVDVSIVP